MINDALLSKMFGMIDKIFADYQEHVWLGKTTEEDFSKLAEEN
jgi:hypothetical protein